tara:strand:+ start:1615 stop:2016 length:402 start_codon:yes stop_codon:yes gene_type:complete
MPWDIHRTTIDLDITTNVVIKTFRVQAAKNPMIQFTGTGLIDTEGLEIVTEYSIDGSQWETLEVITIAATAVSGAVQTLVDLFEDNTVTRTPYFRWKIRTVNQAPLDGNEFVNGTLTTAWWIDDISNNGVGVL